MHAVIIISLLLFSANASGLDVILQVDGKTIRTVDADRVNVITNDQRLLIDIRTKPKAQPPTPPPVEPPPQPPLRSSGCRTPGGVQVPATINWTQPGGQVLCDIAQPVAWAFTTTANPDYQGQISTVEASSRGGLRRVWISQEPGGVPLAPRCATIGRESAVVRWAQGPMRSTCQLELNTRYYVNVEFMECKYASCLLYRNIYTNQQS